LLPPKTVVQRQPEQLRKVIAGIAELQENGQFSATRYKEFLAARNMSP
jgi:peptidyl-prolyl cis-trans isomerase D